MENKFGWKRGENIVLPIIEDTCIQKPDRMPEPTVHQSPSLASGRKKHCYDQHGFFFSSSACSVFAFSVFNGCVVFFPFSFFSPFQLFKTYTHAFLFVIPRLLSVPFLLPFLTTHVQASGWKSRGIRSMAWSVPVCNMRAQLSSLLATAQTE